MKIGILGTRGIPNNYGGFEQFAQFLSQNLTEKIVMFLFITHTIIYLKNQNGKM